MKLYGFYRSSASYRIRIALNYKGIDWEYVSVRLDKGEQREAKYLAMNPMGLVPLLDTGDARIAESAAIAEHLEFLHPQPAMLPDDPLLRAQVREMQHVIGSGVQPVTNLRILQHLRTEFGLDDEGVDRWCQKWIARGFTAFEKFAESRSANGHFSFGDSLTYADAWLLPQYYNANRFGIDLAPFPRLLEINGHLTGLAPFVAATPENQADAP